jgi:hypothetical protein
MLHNIVCVNLMYIHEKLHCAKLVTSVLVSQIVHCDHLLCYSFSILTSCWLQFGQQRIRHMQSVFNRERNKFRNSYESWKENGPPGGYNYIPRDDWYWQSDTSNSENKNKRTYTPAGPRGYPMSHHYSVLGLDRYFHIFLNL